MARFTAERRRRARGASGLTQNRVGGRIRAGCNVKKWLQFHPYGFLTQIGHELHNGTGSYAEDLKWGTKLFDMTYSRGKTEA